MDKFILLHTLSIMAFILAITQFGMLIYLLRLRDNTQIRRWMIVNYSASVIWQVDQMIRGSLHPSVIGTMAYKIETVLVYSPALALLVLSYLQILYLFLYQPYEKERHLMEKIVVPVVIGLVALNAWNEFGNNSNFFVFQVTSLLYGLLTNIWALVISLRKAKLLKNIDKRAAEAHNMLVWVNVGFITMCIVAVAFGLYSPIGYWTFFILIWLCNLGQILAYISYSAVSASFQVKITGFSFVTVVTILIGVTLVFFPPLPLLEIKERMAQQFGLAEMFGIIAVATLFIVSFLPKLLRKKFSEPLKRLLAGVKEVNTGNLKVQVEVNEPDEIGELTLNFNQMTKSLKQANDQLREYADNLEIKVADRTAALKQSLETLQATQAQLMHAEKMASLGELTAGIAHEIQNPLNFVNNFSEVSAEMLAELKEHVANGETEHVIAVADELSRNLLKISDHGGRAAGIVKNMLEHSRPGNALRQTVNINNLCQQYAQLSFKSMVARDYSFNCSLQMDFDPSTDSIEAVSQDIGRVLQNVFNNAFYAVHQKRNQQPNNLLAYEPQVIVSTQPWRRLNGHTGGIEIRIKDNGTGMDDVVKSKIFQPFFTTKPTGQGTGLGLSISYDIVTKGHGGMLSVESQKGEGTEMVIQLPKTNTPQPLV